jgi:hypothetical protein
MEAWAVERSYIGGAMAMEVGGDSFVCGEERGRERKISLLACFISAIFLAFCSGVVFV